MNRTHASHRAPGPRSNPRTPTVAARYWATGSTCPPAWDVTWWPRRLWRSCRTAWKTLCVRNGRNRLFGVPFSQIFYLPKMEISNFVFRPSRTNDIFHFGLFIGFFSLQNRIELNAKYIPTHNDVSAFFFIYLYSTRYVLYSLFNCVNRILWLKTVNTFRNRYNAFEGR